jgi:acyl-CoA synthetase (AMP-forming)/AMP-acid ligase II
MRELAMLLDMAADAFGERIAVTCGDQSLSYAALRCSLQGGVADLAAGGFAHTTLLDTNGLAAPVALFASAYAGVPYVPLNYRLTSGELEELLARVSPAWLVSQAVHMQRLKVPDGIR